MSPQFACSSHGSLSSEGVLPRLNPLMYFYSIQLDVLHKFRTTPCANVGLLHPLDQLIVISRTDNLFPFTPPRMSLLPGTFSQLYIPCGSHHQALSSKSAHATLKTPPFLPVPSSFPLQATSELDQNLPSSLITSRNRCAY